MRADLVDPFAKSCTRTTESFTKSASGHDRWKYFTFGTARAANRHPWD